MKKLCWMTAVLLMFIAACGEIETNTAANDDTGGDTGGTTDVTTPPSETPAADEEQSDRSPWDAAMPAGSTIVAVASNWMDPIASLATIETSDPSVAQKARVTTDGSDAVVTSFNGRLYVINRFGTDTIQVIDPNDFSVIGDYSTGSGTNPQDIYVRSDEKAYITRLDADNDASNTDDILIVKPLTGEITGSVDLTPFTEDDGDRKARAAQVVAVEDRLYVLIQDLPTNLMDPANQPGKVVVVDMTTDAVVDADETAGGTQAIVLDGRNPSDITYSPATKKLYVADTGVFNMFVVDVNDPYGGIEVVDPEAMRTEGIVVDDKDLGNYVNQIRLTQTRGYTIVGGMTVASFDLSTNAVIDSDLYTSPGMYVPDIAIDSSGRVLATERDPANSGVVFLDADTGAVLYGPVDIGATPASITFVD